MLNLILRAKARILNNMRKSELIIFIMILLSFAVGIYLYPQMPGRIASHWNIQGQVDDYMPKFWGLFLMPFVSVGLFLLFVLIPRIDPLKENIEKFRKYFDSFIVLIILFLFYIYTLTILWSFNVKFNMNQVLPPAFGILFFYCGVLIEKAKRNWFIGIRTPWTLSSDNVWDKTHQLGGKLFKIIGMIAFLGLFLSSYTLFFILFPVMAATIYIITYSYFEYRKEKLNKIN